VHDVRIFVEREHGEQNKRVSPNIANLCITEGKNGNMASQIRI
jgi:hypothetical protein